MTKREVHLTGATMTITGMAPPAQDSAAKRERRKLWELTQQRRIATAYLEGGQRALAAVGTDTNRAMAIMAATDRIVAGIEREPWQEDLEEAAAKIAARVMREVIQ